VLNVLIKALISVIEDSEDEIALKATYQSFPHALYALGHILCKMMTGLHHPHPPLAPQSSQCNSQNVEGKRVFKEARRRWKNGSSIQVLEGLRGWQEAAWTEPMLAHAKLIVKAANVYR